MFESPAGSNNLGSNKHSIVLVDTQEDGFVNYEGGIFDNVDTLFDGSPLDDKNVKWVLVDVDGDGDFDAGTDMAIALVDIDGTISTSSTGIFI